MNFRQGIFALCLSLFVGPGALAAQTPNTSHGHTMSISGNTFQKKLPSYSLFQPYIHNDGKELNFLRSPFDNFEKELNQSGSDPECPPDAYCTNDPPEDPECPPDAYCTNDPPSCPPGDKCDDKRVFVKNGHTWIVSKRKGVGGPATRYKRVSKDLIDFRVYKPSGLDY